MLLILGAGVAMVLLMTLIHGFFMYLAVSTLIVGRSERAVSLRHRVRLVGGMILWMTTAAIVEMGAWGGLYVQLGAFAEVEPALYFSSVTYTSLGYGDVVLDESLRLLGSVEALGGIIMSGWSTALVIAAIQRTLPRVSSAAEFSREKAD